MKKNTLLISLFFLCLGMVSLGANGKPEDGESVKTGMVFSLDDVETLKTGSDWEVTIIEGTTPELRIDQAQDRKGWVSYNGGDLQLGVEVRIGINWGFKKHKATLIVPRLPEYLNSSSSSSIHIPGEFNPEQLEVKSSSSSRVYLGKIRADRVRITGSSSSRMEWEDLICQDLEAKLSSSSRVILNQGEARTLTSDLSSSSRLMGEDFVITRSLAVNGSSSSRLEIALTEETKVRGSLTSSSRVVAYGNPPPSLWEIETSSSAGVSAE